MNGTRWLAALILLGASATDAQAIGAVNISWDGCTGPVDKAIHPGDVVSVFASVLGHDQPHRAYQVHLSYGTGAGFLPDAWRFDAAGCAGSERLVMDHLTPIPACPSFQGPLFSFQLKHYSYSPMTGVASTSITVAYPNGGAGNTTQVNPATRYFLGRWQFDHALSVNGPTVPGESCSGAGAPICMVSYAQSQDAASWVDLNGVLRAWPFQNEFVTANGQLGCPGSVTPVPARNTTWGSIKDQYKR